MEDNAKQFANYVESMSEEKLNSPFVKEEYVQITFEVFAVS